MDDSVDKETALARAVRKAVNRRASMYVVWTGSSYAVASEADLDTWWLGATVVAEVMSDGSCVSAD
ncbi:conserved hypothetical protein [Rubrivivax sp. A210]|uniref:hypothetical protein n=1 Tax=Rubrivivax sp. A210 TaxID=2772301 RepID=UPI00191819D8|nr:hypothetical protein [Rubrivivax sp. A210]CAD5366614.1 conserved hypothetical protein [Rubrivivax sp. A210]